MWREINMAIEIFSLFVNDLNVAGLSTRAVNLKSQFPVFQANRLVDQL